MMLRRTFAVAVAAALFTAPDVAVGQTGSVGTIVIAHGGGATWDAQLHSVAAMVQTGGPVESTVLMGTGATENRFQDAARKLVEKGATRIVVVPLLVSSHSSHYQQIRWLAGEVEEIPENMLHHLHMVGIERASVNVPIEVTPALDASPEVAAVLAERALAIVDDPAGRALYIMGHGPNDSEAHAAWMENLRPVAERVRELTGFRDVRVGLVRDDAPAPVRAEAVRSIRDMIELQHELTGAPVAVVPVLIATGQVSLKFPVDLEGLPVLYGGEPLLPHPGMAKVIEARVREAVAN